MPGEFKVNSEYVRSGITNLITLVENELLALYNLISLFCVWWVFLPPTTANALFVVGGRNTDHTRNHLAIIQNEFNAKLDTVDF